MYTIRYKQSKKDLISQHCASLLIQCYGFLHIWVTMIIPVFDGKYMTDMFKGYPWNPFVFITIKVYMLIPTKHVPVPYGKSACQIKRELSNFILIQLRHSQDGIMHITSIYIMSIQLGCWNLGINFFVCKPKHKNEISLDA